jgi:hypothetical protein
LYEKLEERQEHEAREGQEDQDGLEYENSHTETSSLLDSIDSLDADSPTRHARTCETNKTNKTYETYNPQSSKKSYTRPDKPDKHPNEKNETSPKTSLKKIKENNVKNVKTETTRASCAASKPKTTVQTDTTETRTNETNKTNDKSEKTTPHCQENNLSTNSLFTYDLSHDDLLHKNLLHSVSSNDLLPSAHSTTGSDNQNNDTTYLPSGTMDLVGYMETAERLNQLNNINHLNRSNHQLHQTAAYQNPQQNTHLPPHQNANPIQQNREPNQGNHLHPNNGRNDIYRNPYLSKTEPDLNNVSYSAKPIDAKPIDLLTTSNSANPINTTNQLNPIEPIEPIDPTTKHTNDPTFSIGLTKLKDKLLSPHKVCVSVDTNRRKSTANEMSYVIHNDLLPQPDFEYRPIKPSKMRVLYAIAGTIVACVAILVTYQIIRVQIDKRAAARRAQTEKDIANAEDPLTRRDQFITNQAEQTYSTIDRLNSAVARHEEKMAKSKDMINEILKSFNVEQVRELKDRIEKISYDKEMDVEDIQKMIDEMKKRTPRALDKLETLKTELAALTEKRQELSLTNFINQQPVYGADLQKPY